MVYTINNKEIDIKRVFKIAKSKASKPAYYKCVCEEGSSVSGDIPKTIFDTSIYNEDEVMISGVNTVSGRREYYYVKNKKGSLKFKQYKNNIYKKTTDAEMLNHIINPGKTRFLISSFVKNNWLISTLFVLMTAIWGFLYAKTSGNNATNFTYIVAELALPLVAMVFTYTFWLQQNYQESMFVALATSGLTLFATIVDLDFINSGTIIMHLFQSDIYLVYGFLVVAILIILTAVLPVKKWYLYLGIPVFYVAIAMLVIDVMIIGEFGSAFSLYTLGKISFTISLFVLLSVFEKWYNERVFCDCIIKADNRNEEDNYEPKLYKDDFVINEKYEYKSLYTRIFESLGNKDCIRYYNTFNLSGINKRVDLEVYALVKTNPEQIDEFDVIYKLPHQKDELKEILNDTGYFIQNPDNILVCCDNCDEIYYIKGFVKNNKINFYKCNVENDSKLIELVSEIDNKFDELTANGSSECT